eukprot:96985-Amphidinium_carterae.1
MCAMLTQHWKSGLPKAASKRSEPRSLLPEVRVRCYAPRVCFGQTNVSGIKRVIVSVLQSLSERHTCGFGTMSQSGQGDRVLAHAVGVTTLMLKGPCLRTTKVRQ